MELPKDPMMLFSVINMKLRDNYSSLDELCDDLNVEKEDIIDQLKNAGFEYSPEHNCFTNHFRINYLIIGETIHWSLFVYLQYVW